MELLKIGRSQKKGYSFYSNDEVKAYTNKNNPIDNLELLVKVKVAIIHSISLKY